MQFSPLEVDEAKLLILLLIICSIGPTRANAPANPIAGERGGNFLCNHSEIYPPGPPEPCFLFFDLLQINSAEIKIRHALKNVKTWCPP